MTDLNRIVQNFVDLIVHTDCDRFREAPGTPEERAAALQAVLDEAGFFVYVENLEPGAQFSEVLFGYDDIDALLWLHGLFRYMGKGDLLDPQQIVDRIRKNRERRSQEEGMDTTDHERLEAIERQVHAIPTERPSLWAMIESLFRSG